MGPLLLFALLVSSVLLGRLTLDLSALAVVLAIAIWGFYLGFLAVAGANTALALRRSRSTRELGTRARLALALAVPCAYLASVLDCMGLSFHGCTSACSVLTRGVAPVVGGLVVLYGFTAKQGFLVGALALSFGLLVPNCVCYNPVNAFWIDLWGRSPACFGGSFGVTLLAISALHTRRFVVPSLVLAWGVVIAMLAFFVGHHYFDYPW